MNYLLKILSLEKEIFSDLVKKTTLIGNYGELCILYNHAPLVTIIKHGLIHIVRYDLRKDRIYTYGGILEIRPQEVVILTSQEILKL